MPVDLNLMVGGEAGQGIQTIGFVLGKTLARAGLHIFADQDYESRIRGGHNFFRVRASDREVKSQTEKLDMLIALDKGTVDRHRNQLKTSGLIILDKTGLKMDAVDDGISDVPLEKLAEESAGNKLMSNSVAVGAIIGLIGLDFSLLADVIRWHFAKYENAIIEENVRAARAGCEFALRHLHFPSLSPITSSADGNRMFMTGNEAIALGAMAAGCKFVAAYPMTPTTPIMEYLAEKGRAFNIVVVQPEDEIAAINMVVGAGFAGARAMTATSGSGFALMVEGIGLAGITETPAVIVLGERPGPAVGLPTRTEQGELLLAVRVGTGEFPRVVLAPASVEDAFYLTVKGFNLAEKYQVPVIILTDTHLANSYTDVARFNLGAIKIERGELLGKDASGEVNEYKRHRLTESGVSPRSWPMKSAALVVTDGDEHDEIGHLTEDAEMRTQQVAKRLRKYAGLRKEIAPPFFERMPGAGLTLMGWGSTLGAIREASNMLKTEGTANNILHLTEIYPFPSEAIVEAMKLTPQTIVVENNATGQLAYLVRAETGLQPTGRVNKWDGRPISAEYIVRELKKGVI